MEMVLLFTARAFEEPNDNLVAVVAILDNIPDVISEVGFHFSQESCGQPHMSLVRRQTKPRMSEQLLNDAFCILK
jgi:hypothetical protein